MNSLVRLPDVKIGPFAGFNGQVHLDPKAQNIVPVEWVQSECAHPFRSFREVGTEGAVIVPWMIACEVSDQEIKTLAGNPNIMFGHFLAFLNSADPDIWYMTYVKGEGSLFAVRAIFGNIGWRFNIGPDRSAFKWHPGGQVLSYRPM